MGDRARTEREARDGKRQPAQVSEIWLQRLQRHSEVAQSSNLQSLQLASVSVWQRRAAARLQLY